MTETLQDKLAAFATDRPGFVAELSGPWPARPDDDGPGTWISNFKQRQGAGFHEIGSGSSGTSAEEAFDAGLLFLAEWCRRYDLGEDVRSPQVQREIAAAVGIPTSG